MTDFGTVHDPDYRVAVQDFNDFIGKLSEKIVEIDETIPELPVKDNVSSGLIGEGPILTTQGLSNISRYERRTLGGIPFDMHRHSFLERSNTIQSK